MLLWKIFLMKTQVILNRHKRIHTTNHFKSSFLTTDINDEIALEQFIGVTTPLAYGNDGRIRFVTPPDPVSCPHVDVVGTVFRKLNSNLTIFLNITLITYFHLYLDSDYLLDFAFHGIDICRLYVFVSQTPGS